MIGATEVIEARIKGIWIDRIDIEVVGDLAVCRGRVAVDGSLGVTVGEVYFGPSDHVGTADLRFVQGVPVMAYVPDLQTGPALMSRAVDAGAAWVGVIAPRYAARFDGNGVVEWDL